MRAEFTPLRNSDPPAEDNTDVSSGGGSNHATTTIIVVVVGVVGCLIIIFLLYRVLRRSWTPKSAPLPPVQPIAHHREQQLAELADRTNRLSVRNELSYSSTPLGLSPSGSDASLLKALEGDGYASHRGSFYALDNQRDTYDALNGDDGLRLPIPAFGDSRRTSVSSLKSIDSATHPLPPTPVSVAPPSPSQSTFGRPIPRSRPVSQGRPRPTSTVSMASVRSTRSGVPHGPHSQVKIVLPTPLAPALQPHMTPPSADARLSGVENWEGSARTSMVDVWTPALHRSASSYNITQTPSNKPSPNRKHLSTSPSPSPRNSRLRVSSSTTPPSSYTLSRTGTPPVPSIPSWYEPEVPIYATPATSYHDPQYGDKDMMRGRPLTSPSTLPSRQHPASPLRQSHKQQKRSRSQSLVSRVS